MANLTRFRLTNGQPSLAGVSSYRNTFHASLSRLINNSEKLSDEQWFNLLASLLNGWFVFERQFVHPQSQTLIEMLVERKLLNLKQGLRNECPNPLCNQHRCSALAE